jgi:ATP-dependent RNA helicase HelY
VVALERRLERDRAFLDGYSDRMVCDRGDFRKYWALREEAERIRTEASRSDERRRRESVKEAVAGLRPGDVVWVPRASRRGLAVVLSSRDGRPTLLTQDRKFFRASLHHFDEAPRALARVPLPRGNARSARFRRDLAARLVTLNVRPPRSPRARIPREALERAEALETRAREHPCHDCPDRGEHERWAARASKLTREIRGMERRIRTRTETLARQFDRVLRVLQKLEYVKGFTLTERGERLARIYGEADILVAEAMADGLLDGLSPAELAALVSAMVYESRDRQPRQASPPTGEIRARYRRLEEAWRAIRRVEEQHQVELCRELDAGFAETAFQWGEGKPLEDVLLETEMAPGDFVRTCKQLLDLLRQIEAVADAPVSDTAHQAVEAINRGVVAYTGL